MDCKFVLLIFKNGIMENKSLKGKVAIVTGSSRGIGAESAKLLALNGASVVINYLNSKEEAFKIVKEIESFGSRAIAIKANVTIMEEVKDLIDKTKIEFGKIDILVLNASISFPVMPFIEYNWTDFETKLTQELKAAFFSCKAVVPAMINQGSGNIVMISSSLSRTPSEGMIAHSTAKSGIDAFAKSLAIELGSKNIKVNVVAPGLTLTDATKYTPYEVKEITKQYTPLKKLAHPQDIAKAVLFLANDNFITGTYLPVSGGLQIL